MSINKRLHKRLTQLGVEACSSDDTYNFSSHNASAKLLLPTSLPLEEKAVVQLMDFASTCHPLSDSKVISACATPDFHAGSQIPVGTIIATDRDMVIPAAIGTDINCGMRLVNTQLNFSEVLPYKAEIIQQLKAVILEDQRNIPVNAASFEALFNDGLSAWQEALPMEGLWANVDHPRLQREIGKILGQHDVTADAKHAPEVLFDQRPIFRPPHLGTVGSGNHFVEIQIVDEILDRYQAYAQQTNVGQVMIMIHTGSRDIGFYVGQHWRHKAMALWPKAEKHPSNQIFPLIDEDAVQYKAAMGVAARYAWINRITITELIRHAMHKIFKQDNSQLIVDVSHNIVTEENGMNIHRKGATPAHMGELAVIPGSMGDYSYLVAGLGNDDWFASCSHGAGRAIKRQKLHHQTKHEEANLPWECISLKSSRIVEEAPHAYKPIRPVIDVQENHQLIRPIVKLKPWVTFKV